MVPQVPPASSTAADAARRESVPRTRRAVLAAGSTAAVSSLAGCAALSELFAESALEEVNVHNETDDAVSGSVTVVDSDGTTVLEEAFDLARTDEGADSQVGYDGVWGGAGDYEAGIELDSDIAGDSSATETVSIGNPDEEMLVITLGSDAVDETIGFTVGSDLSDLQDEAE